MSIIYFSSLVLDEECSSLFFLGKLKVNVYFISFLYLGMGKGCYFYILGWVRGAILYLGMGKGCYFYILGWVRGAIFD